MKNIKCLLGLIVFVGVVTQSQDSYSYSAFHTCANGSPVRWNAVKNIAVDSCTIPHNSIPDTAIYLAWASWGKVHNTMFPFEPVPFWFNCSLTYGDSTNEIMLVNQQTIGSGLLGLTTNIYFPCAFSSGGYWEGDIILLNTLIYTAEDESFWNWTFDQQGRNVVVHEMGHLIGLGHSENFDVMRGAVPTPLAGGNTSEPFPDDANGARWLYGNPTSNRPNVFSSAQQFIPFSGIVPTNSPVTVNSCRLCNVSVTFTVGNNGSIDVNGVGFRVYLGTSPTDSVGAANLLTASASSTAGSHFTETHLLQIPNNVPNGFYWVLWQIDTGNAVTEFSEFDNRVHSIMSIQVN